MCRRSIRSLVLFIFFSSYVTVTLARYHHIKLRHGRHRRQHGESYLPGNYILDTQEPEQGRWGPWSNPSSCSRSCGGGVAHQTRECYDKDDSTNEDRCYGARKRFFSCNVQACPTNSKDFRAEQCAEFNTQPFEGVYYDWIPYTGGHNKCELNCMPRGERFFYKHKLRVIDGTQCNSESNDVCVEGKCMAVGCDMMLGSDAKEDACKECNGDGSQCNTVQGVFDTDDLKVGYNDILLIPEGATNIAVKERRPSNNYLAIRNATGHYHLNGYWRIDFPRSLRFAGTIFHYNREPQGFSAPDTITAQGPTTEAMYVVLLYQDRNVGVDYQYSVPKKFSQQTDPDSYTWVEYEFSSCNASCGRGFRSRMVNCVKRRTNEVVDDKLCDPQFEPNDTESCNEEPCPPSWVEGEWSPCSKRCGEGGEQTREIKCKQVIYGDIVSTVEESRCIEAFGSKNVTTRKCNENADCAEWHLGPWKPCDHLCGKGKQTRKVTCYKKDADGKINVLDDSECEDEVPEREKSCELRPCEGVDWVTSKWSGCDDKCGLTQETREAQCATQDGVVYTDDMCDSEKKPELKRECETPTSCEYQWVGTQWSQCSAKCGSGMQTRKVFCATFEDEDTMKKVPDDKCEADQKFNTTRNCTAKETDCKGEWFAGPYGQCSKQCGEGEMTRKVVCIKDNVIVSADNCDHDEIIFDTERCNIRPCGEDEVTPVEPEKATTLDDEEECEEDYEDDFVTVSSGLGSDEEEDESESTESSVSGSDSGTTNPLDIMYSDSSRSDTVPYTPDIGETGSGDDANDFTPLGSESTSDIDIEGSGTGFTDVDITTIPSSEKTDETEEYSSSSDVSDSSGAESSISGVTEQITTVFTESTDSSDSSESIVTTESSVSTEQNTEITTDSSMDSSSDSTESTEASANTESSDTTPSDTTPSDTTPSDTTPYDTTPTDVTESTETGQTSDMSTLSSDISETTDASTDVTTEASANTSDYETTTSSSTDVTEVSGTPASETGDTSSTESSDVTEAVTTDSSVTGDTETTISGTTESAAVTESSEGTSSTDVTESGATEESTTLGTTESGMTSESDVSSVSEASTESMTESTTEKLDLSGTTPVSAIWTVSSVDEAITKEHRMRKCKPKKKKSCKSTEFGCCYDGITPALGPFAKGCPIPKTCKETKFGCCPDGVSLATGPDNENCPDTHCEESLFGCCPDGIMAAEGNNMEGCKKPCNETEFGCCPDKKTPAIGKDNLGCCNVTKFGCCPDGIQAAKGKDGKGCKKVTVAPKEANATAVNATTDCANSSFGCCPDRQKSATGKYFEGCNVINTKNCTASYFGCCPDGVSPAHGPNNTGCHMPCHDTEFGCCDDNTTPAHGPNKEGCCLLTPHKCCPDNLLPALGPDFYGCGCLHSRFRCCPDNVTAARGPNNEGCGCEYTQHGCCPNRFTVATGPKYEGCPCYSFQFGCCEDGVTTAKGPHNQGCGCDNSEFKCCPDGKTAAKGPNFAGCTCDTSKYGCCPDGIEEAQGENFEGCLSVPSNPGLSCGLPRDRGTCRNFTVQWFFDTEYGGCSRFWFGGCKGNDNRFRTQEECQATCVKPPGKDACYLPKISGSCEGYNPKWYYDTERKQCGQFIYSGCLGNANKFDTREQCEELCSEPDDVDPCLQSKEPGPCAGNYARWYFNKDTDSCEHFAFGGCKPNKNNFATEGACRQQCVPPGRSRDSCSLPKMEGNCTEKHSKWYFDQTENRCMPFYYSGCGGNKNSFDSREACEFDCPPHIEQDTCLLPALLGECHNYTQRWYYDSYEQRCRQFYYGGCGGNQNNFYTNDECQRNCEYTQTTTAPAPVEFQSSFCFLPDESGPCSKYQPKWFYDSREGICKQFMYGGCGSNGNNFNSHEECESRCGNVQDVCAMPVITGNCNDSVLQYYYDRRVDACYEFLYTGCGGNKNRFYDMQSCENTCRQRRPPYRPPPHTERPTENIPNTEACTQPADIGPCTAEVTAYFYDIKQQSCQAFVYGGCEGNANRYQSEEQCERLCGKFRDQDICHLPADVGPCDGEFTKYHYDYVNRVCREFAYGGCDGNANRFSTRSECESVCIHLEEPTSGNKTGHLTICREPADSGSCKTGNYKRFYYDDTYQTCRAFIYTGCGGNRNNFKTFESCMNTCFLDNTVTEDVYKNTEDRCQEAREECQRARCPYGQEEYVDEHDCQRCQCVDPCRDKDCPHGTRCAIMLVANDDGTEYQGICRDTNKPGRCPRVSNSTRCEEECYSDADCSEHWKCCNNGCGTSCLEPASDERVTTRHPVNNITMPQYGAEPAAIQTPENPRVTGEEGGEVIMRCVAVGIPKPIIVWTKNDQTIGSAEDRRRILHDGSLQIVNLYRYDSGIYICTADNGIGPQAKLEYQLEVTDPHDNPPRIVDEPNLAFTAVLNAPMVLHCYAIGWPRPVVTWWRGERMLPSSSDHYQREGANSLLIRSVSLSNLGVYTCHAFNGIGKPDQWSAIVQAVGPVSNVRPEQEEYTKYLVNPPQSPERPQYPYRPQRNQTHDMPPPGYYYPQRPDHVPTVIPIGGTSSQVPPRYPPEPVTVNISTPSYKLDEGGEITIDCQVRGYPRPRVTWYKNEVPIQSDEHIHISENNRLTISQSNTNDTGRYRCEGANQYSSNSEYVDVRVEYPDIEPSCIDDERTASCKLIVRAKYCKHEYYSKVCCRSCTQAGQLPPRNQNNLRKRRSIFTFV